jgi:membrane-associated phospholipid phosphatase
MEQSRSLAMVQLAVHDALNAIEPRYASYAFEADAAGASPEAAVASASHGVLVALLPAQAGEIDAWYAETLATVAEGDAKARGVQVGSRAAAHLVALRRGDDVAAALGEAYVPGNTPGDYRATPPYDVVFGAGWGKLATFATPHASAFRPAPPPQLGSRRYTRDYEEVKALGLQASDTRSPEQTQIADFWYESSATGWVRITNALAVQKDLDDWDSARLLALVSLALADGFINGFDAKYHYDYWRPITAIRAGDADGNRRTQGDPGWTPYCETPPVADYPSTHSVLGAAAAAVLSRQFGDSTPFTSDSLTLPGVTRQFTSFSQAARENADSRVYCGIHWRSSTRAGLEQGQRIGELVFEQQLAPTCRQ